MNPTTKIYKGYQTVIPLEIRKKLNVTDKHVLEWTTTKEGEAKIRFKEKNL